MQSPPLTDHLTPAAALDSSLCVWGGTWGGLSGKAVDGLRGHRIKRKGHHGGAKGNMKDGEKDGGWRLKGLRMKMGDGAIGVGVGWARGGWEGELGGGGLGKKGGDESP